MVLTRLPWFHPENNGTETGNLYKSYTMKIDLKKASVVIIGAIMETYSRKSLSLSTLLQSTLLPAKGNMVDKAMKYIVSIYSFCNNSNAQFHVQYIE